MANSTNYIALVNNILQKQDLEREAWELEKHLILMNFEERKKEWERERRMWGEEREGMFEERREWMEDKNKLEEMISKLEKKWEEEREMK